MRSWNFKNDDEILLVDKPKGITSFGVIRQLRKKLGIRKMGHAGTLDPSATGLLIVGVGKTTKYLGKFLKLPKTYEVEVLLGVKTDTGDMEGKIAEEKSVSSSNLSAIYGAVKALPGKMKLPVPAYSAIKQGGEALYKKARRGETFALPEKVMEIYRAELLGTPQQKRNHIVLSVCLEVSSGTYVRSIVEEIGRRLGIPAVVKELRRTKIGNFDVHNAKKLGELLHEKYSA